METLGERRPANQLTAVGLKKEGTSSPVAVV